MEKGGQILPNSPCEKVGACQNRPREFGNNRKKKKKKQQQNVKEKIVCSSHGLDEVVCHSMLVVGTERRTMCLATGSRFTYVP